MAFSDTIRAELSIETGGFCANPDCRSLTGPHIRGAAKSTGDGAHIVAENPGGARGQSPLTQSERAMASNGVWLCPKCHRIVDVVRPEDYSIELLHDWKIEARAWWARSQGMPLQLAARPNTRMQVARASPNSLRGARNFLQLHVPLICEIQQLRYQHPAPFERDVPISSEVEHQIHLLSSSKKWGRSWQDEWSTTYHCDDSELVHHMQDLIGRVDSLRRSTNFSTHTDTLRRVNFSPPDSLAEAVLGYLAAGNALDQCLKSQDNWGL